VAKKKIKVEGLCFKKLSNFTFVILCIILVISCGISLGKGEITDFNKKSVKMDTYTESILKKCNENDRVNLFVMLNSSVTAEQVKMLESIGCTVKSSAGDVITVNIQVGKIKQLTEFYFVNFIEFSRLLKIEKEEE